LSDNLVVHFNPRQFERLESLLSALITSERQTMSAITDALSDLNSKVAALESAETSAITLLQGLKSALDAALALGDPAAIAAEVSQIAAKIGSDTQSLAAAVTANTPAAAAPAAPAAPADPATPAS